MKILKKLRDFIIFLKYSSNLFIYICSIINYTQNYTHFFKNLKIYNIFKNVCLNIPWFFDDFIKVLAYIFPNSVHFRALSLGFACFDCCYYCCYCFWGFSVAIFQQIFGLFVDIQYAWAFLVFVCLFFYQKSERKRGP